MRKGKIWAVIDWSKVDGGRSQAIGFRRYTAAIVEDKEEKGSKQLCYVVGTWTTESLARLWANKSQELYERALGRSLAGTVIFHDI
jgi:hypothetical protein